MSHTPVQLTIDEPAPGRCTPECVLLVCPRCAHPFLRHAAALARGAWRFSCPACRAPLALDAMAGRSLRGHGRWAVLKRLVAT